ncbi:MAG: hypothetical protein M1827_002538 [Pycnora praestabilis]|nr:MAG: hypothetical protein M1827_002538 [Pycnora praestabilis]
MHPDTQRPTYVQLIRAQRIPLSVAAIIFVFVFVDFPVVRIAIGADTSQSKEYSWFLRTTTFVMHISLCGFAALAAAMIPHVVAVGPTDSYSDADPAQSGYLPNHNMDPAVVDSAEFGQLWKNAYNYQEQFYAKPLVYTSSATGTQIVFLASSQNWIRTIDAKTGEAINSRLVHNPFLQSDIGCTDIPNYIGIIGTPVIDPATDTAYFFSKTYIPGFRTPGDTGTINGVYYFHGVDVNTLEDKPGWPILCDGSVSDNDPLKYFIGGTILQRPALTQVGNYVYGAFGGHCDLFNYTGLVLGIDITQQKIVTNFATEAGPLVPHDQNWIDNAGGGQGGIWMSGMAMATDGDRLFFVTGNGDGHQNSGTPATGSSGCQTLGEAVVDIGIDPDTGVVSLDDYFQPFDYQGMDGGDEDFGSGGICLLDPTAFSGTGVSRMGITAGKNGKIYIVNADNLGGYKLGNGQSDAVIQTIVTNEAVFGGSGSYPLEGGWFYSTPVGYPTYAYKLGFSDAGVPQFTEAGQSHETSAGRVGVGIPTVTSYQGKTGTAILWMADPDAGLRAWHAVPGDDGYLQTINLPQVNGANKFQRPAFGDTRLYITDANGVLYCLGSPVNLPLNCTSPVDFGKVALGTSAKSTVTCNANIAITSLDGLTTGDAHFVVSNASLPQGPLAAGATFTFPVTWDLTQTTVQNSPNASYGNTSPGVKSTALTVFTTNAVTGYSTEFPISLTGIEVSEASYLTLEPVEVSFGGIVLTNDTVSTITSNFVIGNAGLQPMTILGYAWTTDDLDDDNLDFTNSSTAGGANNLGYGFESDSLPAIGSVVAAGQSITVPTTFNPVNGTGTYSSYFFVWTTGGKGSYIILIGSASTAPIADFSISNGEGGWLPPSNLLMDFGDVAPGDTATRQIRICNSGGSVLTISKSKPPNGQIRATAPGIDLHESQQVPIGTCAYGTVIFNPNTEPPNVPDQVVSNTWTLNTDDLNFGVHVVDCEGTTVDNVIGPTLPNGDARYNYLGCFIDSVAGRLLPQLAYTGDNNTNEQCQTLCEEGGYVFAGTEYQVECWCGNVPPSEIYYYPESDAFCTFACSGNGAEACGGIGGYQSIYYDSTKFNGTLIETGSGSASGPVTVPSVGTYSSIGCYSEGTAGRALTGLAPATPAGGLTIEACEEACLGYTYFGTEFADECYCGNTINAGSIPVAGDPATSGCSMPCNGNSSEYCGGPNRLNMYQTNSTTAPVGPVTPPGGPVVAAVAGYVSLGCYSEGTNGRALSGSAFPGATNTPVSCAASCAGFTYFGVEYSDECYCGNSFAAGSMPIGGTPDISGCSMTCAGNSTEYCGGPNRLNVYQTNGTLPVSSTMIGNPSAPTPTPSGPIIPSIPGYLSLGCYNELSNGRALSAKTYAGALMTVEYCATTCSGYKYFGIEYADECYCDNNIASGSNPVAGTPTVSGCSMTCANNASEYCGGPNRLNIYQSNGTLTSSTSVVSSPTASPTVPAGPLVVPAALGYLSLGCYTEATNSRALTGYAVSGNTMTVEFCASACSAYAYFGVEYSAECYCGNVLQVGSVPATDNGCTMTCSGNATEYCGGPNRLNMYHKNSTVLTSTVSSGTAGSPTIVVSPTMTPTPTPTPTPSGPITVQAVGKYSYQGCYSEATNQRALTGGYLGGATITVELCASTCSGFTWFGVEYSQECYCGSSPNVGSALVANQADCDMPCAGNASEYCGAGNRLNMYKLGIASSTNQISSSNSSSIAAPTTSVVSSTVLSSSIAASTTPVVSSTVLSTSSAIATPTGPVVVQGNVNFTYSACYEEPANARALSTLAVANDSMTIEICLETCYNYAFVGVEYGRECWCGSTLNPNAIKAPTENQCSMTCSGNSSEICGAGNRLSMYTLKPPVKAAAAQALSISPAALITNATTYPTMTAAATSSNITVSNAVVAPSTSAVVSSSSISSTSSAALTSSTSSIVVSTSLSSNSSSVAPSTMSESFSASSTASILITTSSTSTGALSSSTSTTANSTTASTTTTTTTSALTFVPTPGQTVGAFVYLGCSNSTSPPPLIGASYTNATGMTNQACQDICVRNNYGLAATQNSTGCLCGNGLQSYSTVGQTGCNAPCSGNSSEICGAATRLSVYNSTSSTIPPTTVKAVGEYQSEGCYNGPALTGGATYTNKTGMTVESCVSHCSTGEPGYVGITYATQCFCDFPSPSNSNLTSVDISQCNNLCSGNSREFCGAYNKFNVYGFNSSSLDGNGVPYAVNQPNDVNLITANLTMPSRKMRT